MFMHTSRLIGSTSFQGNSSWTEQLGMNNKTVVRLGVQLMQVCGMTNTDTSPALLIFVLHACLFVIDTGPEKCIQYTIHYGPRTPKKNEPVSSPIWKWFKIDSNTREKIVRGPSKTIL